jgi:hypothetical protein
MTYQLIKSRDLSFVPLSVPITGADLGDFGPARRSPIADHRDYQTNYWGSIMSNGRTPKRRERQAALIRTRKP